MHPFFTNSSNVPAFLVKLWKLVGDPSTDELITWNHNGSSFIITDSERFARELLPQYFKHNNNASFIRQLNMYGFRKVMNYGKANDSRELEFQHAFFSRDRVELLTNIKRKIAASKIMESEPTNLNPKDILTNLSTLREKQKTMDTTLTKMKKENELLWRELSSVRQRHKAQEQVLHKVIQFLVQIIQRSNQSIHVPRKLARMLQDSSVSQENSSQIARIVDALRSKDSECIIVPDEATSKTLGAVIHEVTDFESDISSSPKSPSVTKFNTTILKPLPSGSKNGAVPLDSSNNAASSSLEPLNILENLHNRTTLTVKKPTAEKNTTGIPISYVACPVQGDPNKLVLIPAENFTSQEISSLKEDSFCNVIALPEKGSDSDINSVSASNPLQMNDVATDSLRHEMNVSSNKHNTSEISCLNSLQSTGGSSKQVPDDFSVLVNDFEASVLSDLLQASKISANDEDCDQNGISATNKTKQSIMDEDTLDLKLSLESCNNQLAIPGPSSLVKSTKNCYPDFSILQDPLNSAGMDVNYFEQLFSSDDANNSEFFNQLITDDVINSSDDIMGNELVQFTPSVMDNSNDSDTLRWHDYFNQESFDPDADLSSNFYCGPKDTDVLINSNDSTFPSGLEVVKKEVVLTTPRRNHYKNTKRNKRRKVK